MVALKRHRDPAFLHQFALPLIIALEKEAVRLLDVIRHPSPLVAARIVAGTTGRNDIGAAAAPYGAREDVLACRLHGAAVCPATLQPAAAPITVLRSLEAKSLLLALVLTGNRELHRR